MRFWLGGAAHVAVLAVGAAGEFEYELTVPACASTGSTDCAGAQRHELDELATDVLALLETDAECVRISAVHPNPLTLATCALPAALSLKVFAAAASMRAACRFGNCNVSLVMESIQGSYGHFRERAAAAASTLALPEAIRATVRRYSLEQAEVAGRVLSELWSPHALSRWEAQPNALAVSALGACQELGLNRRLLLWRVNVLRSAVDFGLTAHLPLLAPRAQFFHSRVEVLSELLRLQPLPRPPRNLRFVEVGVHLARVAFALLTTLPALHYTGVDPFVYAPSESAAKQLQDLDEVSATELSGQVRRAAEAKLSLFPGRAELIALPSVQAAGWFPDASVDGVFVDGDHSYAQVVRDLEAWEPKVKPGGFLSGHDFGNHPDVARAVVEQAAAGNRTVHLAMDWVWYWHV